MIIYSIYAISIFWFPFLIVILRYGLTASESNHRGREKERERLANR